MSGSRKRTLLFVLEVVMWVFFLDAGAFMLYNSYVHGLFPDFYIGVTAFISSFIYLAYSVWRVLSDEAC